METRTITQVKAYKLLLNPMHARTETISLVAISYDRQELIDWYESLKVESYIEENWHKTFKKGSKLEWYNPFDHSSYGGIQEEWTTLEEIDKYINYTKQSFGMLEVPQII